MSYVHNFYEPAPRFNFSFFLLLIFMGLEFNFVLYFISRGNENIFMYGTYVTLIINVLSTNSTHPRAPNLCI